MVPAQHWARNFAVTDEDIEHIVTLLLEKETPLSSYQLAHILIENRLDEEVASLEAQYKDAAVYNPAKSFKVGQKLVFPVLDYSTAVVTEMREGHNPGYGAFNVIAVEFEGDDEAREFAADLETPHALSEEDGDSAGLTLNDLNADDILDEEDDSIIEALVMHLRDETDLVHLGGRWFPKDLMLEINEGHLNLAEAVLDINGGGPMKTRDVIKEMGGLGKSPVSLQDFSMNYALNSDPRFDEVGPSGEVQWYLARMEPEAVQNTPELLTYTPIQHDQDSTLR